MANTEWIEWRGGECPVADGTQTEVNFRNGATDCDDTPEGWRWRHCDHESDIIAYRIVSDKPRSVATKIETVVASHRDGAIRLYFVGDDEQGRKEMALELEPAAALKLTVDICTAYADWFRETEMTK